MNSTLAAALTAADAEKHSAPVTHLGQRIGWTVLTLLFLAGVYLLMWRGWRRRQAAQGDVAALNPVPGGVVFGDGVEATYVSTTSEGDWLDRIAVHGLGARSEASVAVAPAGVLIERASHGAPDVFIPADAVRGVRLVSGMAGKYLREDGIVVVTWSHGDRVLDTGVKTRLEADRAILVEAIEKIQPNSSVTATGGAPAGRTAAAVTAATEGTNE